ncbi:MAG: glycosyltransferase family 39 protein [Nitrospirota bacterium]
MFAIALSVRLYKIGEPPLDFSTIRQYQNAHIARGIFYETNDLISEEKKRIARINMERMGFVLEPRIIENAAVLGYRMTGAENLWVPRLLSSIFWIVGGIFLYLTARMLFSASVAFFSAFFYLFLPYSILSSRIFQPDPLMVMLMLGSIYGIMRYDERLSRSNLVTAAVVAAVAVLVKPYCVFIIFGAFLSLVIFREGFWKALFQKNTILFGLLIILPSIIYYGYPMVTNTGFLGEHAKGSFLPHLIISPSFWGGWLSMIGRVTGYIAFILAVLGLFKAGRGRTKNLLLGLWAGYLLFGLSATYQMHTHSYYHMPFIPIAALSLAPIADIFIGRKAPLLSARTKIIFLTGICIISVGLFLSVQKMPLKDMLSQHKAKLKTAALILGVNTEIGRFLRGDFNKEIAIAKEIGERVGHSHNTLFLTPHFGRVITYHGEFAGLPWPTSNSLYGRRVRGARIPDIEKDFTPEHITLLYQGKFIVYTPDFFIITAFDEFEKQADLRKVLYSNYPVLVRNDDYLIFDLRKMSE